MTLDYLAGRGDCHSLMAEDATAAPVASIAPPPASPIAAVPQAGAPPEDPRVAFEQRLAREILTAERFRATLLAVIPTVAMLAFLAVSSAYPAAVTELLHGKFDRVPVGLFLCAVAGFEFRVLYETEKALRLGTRASAARRYAYTFVETSLPTLVILYYSTLIGPVQALLMPSAFVYFVFIVLATLRLDFALCAFTGLVAAVEYAAVALFWGATDTTVAEPTLSSLPHHLGKACILLVSGVSAGFVARRLRKSFTRAIESLEERARILGVFGQHVSPEVAAQLVGGQADARGEARDVCVMFLDIRNFTAFAEKKSAGDVVAYLNVIFDDAVAAVTRHRGIVNKFLGDGFMAVFGAPVPDPNACAAAIDAGLAVLARVERLVREGRIPPTRVGIGLHSGPAVVGNIGSSQRKEYTVIGDVVNLASRVEALNKELGSRMLITDDVWRAANTSRVDAVPREPIHVKGREAPVNILQLA
jgi:adenylate cyclase